MSLDKLDRVLLFALDSDSRQSLSRLAAQVGRSKETCAYRLAMLKNREVISSFEALVGLGKLGVFPYKIYFQLHGQSDPQKAEMISSLKKNRKIGWIAECVGAYDLVISILCKNPQEFNSEKDRLLSKYSAFVEGYEVGVMADTRIYPRSYLAGKDSDKEWRLVGEAAPQAFSGRELAVMRALVSDSRAKATDIARKTKLNVKTVVSTIRRLEESKAIHGYKVSLNLDAMGYKFYKAFVRVGEMAAPDRLHFTSYCKLNRNIIHLVENVGGWEFEPEFEVESDDEFYRIVAEMKQKFPSFIKGMQIVRVIREHKSIYSPLGLEG